MHPSGRSELGCLSCQRALGVEEGVGPQLGNKIGIEVAAWVAAWMTEMIAQAQAIDVIKKEALP